MIICIIATTAKEDVGTFNTIPFGGKSPAWKALLNFFTYPMRLASTSIFTTLRPPIHPPRASWRVPTIVPGRGSTMEPTKPSDITVIGEELVFIVIGGAQIGKVDLVPK